MSCPPWWQEPDSQTEVQTRVQPDLPQRPSAKRCNRALEGAAFQRRVKRDNNMPTARAMPTAVKGFF